MLSVASFRPGFTFLWGVLLSGCVISYAPSTTDWNKTPKIVLQVCVSSSEPSKAEIKFYRSPPLMRLDFGPSVRGKSMNGYPIFEVFLEDPSPLHDAIGIRIEQGLSQGSYVFRMPAIYTSDWSPWIQPDTVEDSLPATVDKFKFFRGKRPLNGKESQVSPKIRTRLEYPKDFNSPTGRKDRYKDIPDCGSAM